MSLMKKKEPIAIVGLSGIFPGAANVDDFWRNIINKVDCIKTVPDQRWIAPKQAVHQPDYAVDKACSLKAGLIDPFHFEAHGFALPPDLLTELDPLFQLVLTAGREVVEDCGISALEKKRTGVILASIALPTDASSLLTREILGRSFEHKLLRKLGLRNGQKDQPLQFPRLSKAQCLSARVTGLTGALLAKGLGLGGGSYTLDAACASSLYAVKLACDELQAERMDVMLAGGVSRPECLYTQVGFTQLQALSPTGRCAPFDRTANGLVVGEGVGLLALKRLGDARRDGNKILALIHGIGLSNDIGGNLLAPDSEGQVRAMQNAYDLTAWSPEEIELIECHGAGTPVGDTIELTSLHRLWRDVEWKKAQCALGSIKSMIGHLLTGAGAAGLIKTVLALKHRILPPSLNFSEPAENSPLWDSPFRVQTEPAEWTPPLARPRRAAVSAFGFGGINAHLLLEECPGNRANAVYKASAVKAEPGLAENVPAAAADPLLPLTPTSEALENPDVAIIGMEALLGRLNSLGALKEALFNGRTFFSPCPPERLRGCDELAAQAMGGALAQGNFLEELAVLIGEFHIPPNEIPDILPQHLIMLKVAAGAMADAGLPKRQDRPRMGVTIGMEYDFGANDFHLRWNLSNEIEKWIKGFDPPLAQDQIQRWLADLRDACGPPLTAARTVGALGGMVASRVAKEFRLGGPSFVVSCEAASGIKALEIGVRSLQMKETDLFLVGAVDLPADVRNLVMTHGIKPYSPSPLMRPFDQQADGCLPGEGAVAVVLKRLDQALADGDRVYAVIKGMGSACGGDLDQARPSTEAYQLALRRCFRDAQVAPASISYVEAHGSAYPAEDRLEAEGLSAFFQKYLTDTGPRQDCTDDSIAMGALKANIGHTGAAAGLAALIKTALCLYHEIVPPLPHFESLPKDSGLGRYFHFPRFPYYWARNRQDGPRRALVAGLTSDGNCVQTVLEGLDYFTLDKQAPLLKLVEGERRRPLGAKPVGLFLVEADSPDELIQSLDNLYQFARRSGNGQGIMERTAAEWYEKNPPDYDKEHAVAFLADSSFTLGQWIQEAQKAIEAGAARQISGATGFKYTPRPLGHQGGEIAFVFPGSGNHYVGLGRVIAVTWPGILRRMDAETRQLKTQLIPSCYVPFRDSWTPGWETQAHAKIVSDPLHMIFGQVVHGGVMAELVGSFDIRPQAVIGYSLGESAGLFAMKAWPERGHMLERMEHSNLFRTELAGPCNAARKVWRVPPEEDVAWCVAAVNRPAAVVKEIIRKYPAAELLIVNTPAECVIGGRRRPVEALINRLGCDAFYLEGVVTVHCQAAVPVKEAYKALHVFPTTPPPGIRFYSCTFEKAYTLTSEKAATSIVNQAMFGFDFPNTIQQAYKDGVRIFLEMGPHGSCTRMIDSILTDQPHLALSACAKGEDDYTSVIKFLGSLAAERIPVNLGKLYGPEAYPQPIHLPKAAATGREIRLVVGGEPPAPPLPEFPEPPEPGEIKKEQPLPGLVIPEPAVIPATYQARPAPMADPGPTALTAMPDHPYTELFRPVAHNIAATAVVHDEFLNFSNTFNEAFTAAIAFQHRLIEKVMAQGDHLVLSAYVQALELPRSSPPEPEKPGLAFSREMCMEFAVGSLAKVLGSQFAVVDTYKARVRLPDEPLMLVDRILTVEGEKGSLGSGRLVTEHDVRPGAWYLDGGCTPVCIAIEAGQADLFLCSYLGIDLAVKGTRTYRLLDAVATFHYGLPRPGDVIRYEIEIEKFIRSGETYMFFFHFNGFVGERHIISMRKGCAGFFTPEEVKNSGGIILTEAETRPVPGKKPGDWQPLVPMAVESYDDAAVDALRAGDAGRCFGPHFAGIFLSESTRLPGGRMRLIHRVTELNPDGGRFGLGMIKADADIHPDDWFLTCHFVDDKVMPGTLMYECCAHTLRVLLLRMGWVTEKEGVCYEPVPEKGAVLKCRGPVTPETRKVTYQVELKEIGYNPEPYVLADALMYADGERIVMFKDMSMKMTGLTRAEVEAFWAGRSGMSPQAQAAQAKPTLYSREQLLAFCQGKPSEAFGEPYAVFDQERIIARLPRPPYFFMDRITRTDPAPWVLKAGGWIEAEYRIPAGEWYFKANRIPAMAFCILLEIALQPCGWLAAYAGSALRSSKDLKFRNLGGNAVLYHNPTDRTGLLTMRARMTKVSEAGGMIIEDFDLEVLQGSTMIYKGRTNFGFFSQEALANQVGIQTAKQSAYQPTQADINSSISHVFSDQAPLTPEDQTVTPAPAAALPAKALRMIDEITIYAPDGGPNKLGFIRGIKRVDPEEWFFKAHFHQDPVCPGSLGVESFLQLVKFMALHRFPDLSATHTFEMVTEVEHNWIYRGQVIQTNQIVEVDAWITRMETAPCPTLFADGYLKVDGLYIYQMRNFGIRLVPI